MITPDMMSHPAAVMRRAAPEALLDIDAPSPDACLG